MKVEIWSDVMCPFCYIGKRKFESALSQFPHKDEVQVIWKSFQLAPEIKTRIDKNIHQFLSEHKVEIPTPLTTLFQEGVTS
ncbi:DSBA-like thioredoxin domain-containing protein [Chryseolinea serpens]|uniref:DSBA-like thioredoxin domain-containing protein n=2 Tax=Chryseolinea serpens TaxID=947013 RepID=A0A1M5TD92_9BACT|nr:DSBA-like thioredoxin domain-containing protein [Chryseolinea serpens]